MHSDGSLQGGLFDLSTQAGIMHLLASVRASDLSADKKHDLRDTIFLYTNGGRDESVKLSLEQKITSYQVAPVAGGPKNASTTPPPQYTIGGSRPAPDQFLSRPVVASVSAVVQPVVAPPPPPPLPPVTVPPQLVVQAPPPQPLVQTPRPAPITEVAPAPTTSLGDSAAYLERIREIKALVNQRVGNPVHLVDIDAEVGREYMGALLDAMKKINSGTSAISAMKRLEDAFISVDKVLANQNAVVPPAAQAAPIPVSVPKQTPPPPLPSTQPPAPVPTPLPVISQPVPQPVPVTPPTPVAISRPAPVTPAPQPEVSRPMRPATGALEIKSVAEPVAQESSWSTPVASKESGFSAAKLSSLATPPAAPVKREASAAPADPLFTPEIDRGLDQLLSEWSLFKKSGLFGSGAKGREHPLFKKIAGLQIPLLLAGRFEGATQEIKQSITDYMNGWRYEQGIIYMQGETFERYLRRVIKHILDLQKKASRS